MSVSERNYALFVCASLCNLATKSKRAVNVVAAAAAQSPHFPSNVSLGGPDSNPDQADGSQMR